MEKVRKAMKEHDPIAERLAEMAKPREPVELGAGAICKTCSYWRSDVTKARGFCRARSPVQGHDRLWPATAQSDWCGEWTPRGVPIVAAGTIDLYGVGSGKSKAKP